jgi:hypothetical protein
MLSGKKLKVESLELRAGKKEPWKGMAERDERGWTYKMWSSKSTTTYYNRLVHIVKRNLSGLDGVDRPSASGRTLDIGYEETSRLSASSPSSGETSLLRNAASVVCVNRPHQS